MKLLTGALVAGSLAGMAVLPAAADDIKLGGIYSIEGVFSAIGGPERDAALLAVEQWNQAGGIGGKHVTIKRSYDDGGDQGRKTVQLANRLIFQDKVSAAFGRDHHPDRRNYRAGVQQNKMLEIGVVAQDYL